MRRYASPFPGMDPYLEQFWGDVHHTMINRSRAAIQKQLPADLVARVDERVFVEPSEGLPRNIIPDVRIVERGRREEPLSERVMASPWPNRWSSTLNRTIQCGKGSSRSSTSRPAGEWSP